MPTARCTGEFWRNDEHCNTLAHGPRVQRRRISKDDTRRSPSRRVVQHLIDAPPPVLATRNPRTAPVRHRDQRSRKGDHPKTNVSRWLAGSQNDAAPLRRTCNLLEVDNRRNKTRGPDVDGVSLSRRPAEVTCARAKPGDARLGRRACTARWRMRSGSGEAVACRTGGPADGGGSRTACVRLGLCGAAAAYGFVLQCTYGRSAPPSGERGCM
ncbi:hypothetical protein CERSUDRAFT_101350 [Gelatoporia subvermispora B]|uniref:Uncharacterized protein n=1 Tax=Ceriporiopsis subvermispora (strain B) TaxID=914234 RepID=M2QVC6_CERS8|nr:hypothetical protein CERSUDRAFT_101350 [Gelatoporia subvermispora B]